MILVIGLDGYDYRWRDTLCHEYVHYVLMKKTGNRVPLWLHEGIAKFEETRWRSAQGGRLPPVMASLLADGVENSELVTFERMHPTFAKLDGQEATLAFAQVSTMVEMLVAKEGLEGLRALLDELRAGQSVDAALDQVTGGGVERFQAKWLK